MYYNKLNYLTWHIKIKCNLTIAFARNMRRVIVDVDVGIDDFLAVLLLLCADIKNEIKLEAITCTMGNADVDNVCRNVVKLLEVTNRTDVSNKKLSLGDHIKISLDRSHYCFILVYTRNS